MSLKCLIAVGVALLCLSNAQAGLDTRTIRKTPEYQDALAVGAKALIRLFVADENCRAVSNAEVRSVFDMTTYSVSAKGTTERQGICELEGKTRGESITVKVIKGGYYTSREKLCLIGPVHAHAVKEGKWQPYPLREEIVLKKKHNPIKSMSNGGVYHIPTTNEWCSFDFVANDWVAPRGRGQTADVELKFSWIGNDRRDPDAEILQIRFVGNPCNGAYQTPAQTQSEFPYSYAAVASRDYVREFRDEIKRDTRKFGMLDGSLDFVFRFRSVTDPEGHIVSCHYGRFRRIDYGLDRTGQVSLLMRYDYNDKPNDTNLEFLKQ